MFIIAIAVIVPLMGLVVYTTRHAIGKVAQRIQQRMRTRKWFQQITWHRQLQTFGKKWDGDDGENASSVTEVPHSEPEQTGKSRLRLKIWKAKKKVVDDAEKGA